VNDISGLAEGGYGPLVNTGKHDAFKSYYTRFNTFSLLPVSFFYINASKHHRKSLSTACFCLAAVFFSCSLNHYPLVFGVLLFLLLRRCRNRTVVAVTRRTFAEAVRSRAHRYHCRKPPPEAHHSLPKVVRREPVEVGRTR